MTDTEIKEAETRLSKMRVERQKLRDAERELTQNIKELRRSLAFIRRQKRLEISKKAKQEGGNFPLCSRVVTGRLGMLLRDMIDNQTLRPCPEDMNKLMCPNISSVYWQGRWYCRHHDPEAINKKRGVRK